MLGAGILGVVGEEISVCRSGLVFGPQNRQPATATGLNWLQPVATSISKKQSKMVENCVFTHKTDIFWRKIFGIILCDA